jgi:peptidyl-prolyl cis-trans isomerase D
MSIIQTIRDKGSWVMFTLLALALISFIFMDAGRRDSIFGGGGNKSVGSVNGTKLNNETYGARTDALRKIYADNKQITETQINGYVWNSMINEKLMKGELNKIGFSMSDKDLVDFVLGKYGQPNQHIVPFFNHYMPGSGVVDQQTGQLNQQMAERAYKQYLRVANGENGEAVAVFKALLGMAKSEFLIMKHGNMMANTTYIPLWMAKKQMTDNNTLANISYVHVPYTDINDSLPEMKVSDDEIVKYMDKRKYMYQQTESRLIDYALFDFTPTSNDSNTLKQQLMVKKEELRNIKDSLSGNFVTTNNSLTPYEDKYLRKKDITIKDSSGYAQGAVFGPYLDPQNRLTVAKITAVKSLHDTVSARHILVQVFDPNNQKVIREDAEAKSIMDSVLAQYRSGISFDSLARKYSDDPGSKDSGGLYKTIGLNQFVPEFNEFVFNKSIGDTGVVKTIFGYHFIQVTGRKGSPSPAYKVAYLSRAIEASQVTRDSVSAQATSFAAACRTAAAFDDYFVKNPDKLKKLTSREITKESEAVEMFQKARELVKWIYKAELGTVSEPITFDKENKIVVAKLNAINKEGLQDPKKARMGLETTIRNDRKYEMLAKKYGSGNSLEEMATKTGKQVVVKDSISFESASLPGIANEPRVAGVMLNATYQAKMSGPIKGVSGVFYVKVNGQPYAKPGANNDVNAIRQQMQQTTKQGGFGADAYRRDAKIKDKRLEVGY